jgi:rare lipoprotein A
MPRLTAPALKPRPMRTGKLAEERRGAVAKIGKPYQVAGRWYTPSHQPDYEASGMASWYGPEFHGKKTANGEIYNKHRLTAAHPTLPMPCYVTVTNQENGRVVVVRINDRGPYARGRIIDVSQRAAELLGFARSGTGRVTVRYLGTAPMNADDTFEQAFLAKQPWLAGGPRLASVPLDGWDAATAQ